MAKFFPVFPDSSYLKPLCRQTSARVSRTKTKHNTAPPNMSTDGTKSPLAWLTAGTSAVVCLGFAQTAGGRYRRPPSKKPKATDLTTAVDHGNMAAPAKVIDGSNESF